ncbi:hypothetical protein GCM10020331_078950 [Ectobacillus funiculus]
MQEAVLRAQSIAVERSHQEVDIVHVLAALLEQEDGLTARVMQKAWCFYRTVSTRSAAALRTKNLV